LHNVPPYIHAMFSLSIHLSTDIWVVSTFWLSQVMLLLTWVWKYLFFDALHLILWSVYSKDELLHHVNFSCKFLRKFHTVFHRDYLWKPSLHPRNKYHWEFCLLIFCWRFFAWILKLFVMDIVLRFSFLVVSLLVLESG
jgi:hypothetical protein